MAASEPPIGAVSRRGRLDGSLRRKSLNDKKKRKPKKSQGIRLSRRGQGSFVIGVGHRSGNGSSGSSTRSSRSRRRRGRGQTGRTTGHDRCSYVLLLMLRVDKPRRKVPNGCLEAHLAHLGADVLDELIHVFGVLELVDVVLQPSLDLVLYVCRLHPLTEPVHVDACCAQNNKRMNGGREWDGGLLPAMTPSLPREPPGNLAAAVAGC